MWILAASLVGLWAVSVGLVIFGTFQVWRHFHWGAEAESTAPADPVSILKPVKGSEPGLEENLESFFHLDASSYELIFSVADAKDPAVSIIRRLIQNHPGLPAELIVGDVQAGLNPKINNLMRSYERAAHDWVLISDSNVLAGPDYLKSMMGSARENVGIVTAVVVGMNPVTPGGWLEATYLNTFYARWMFISAAFNQHCVVGKSMLFRKSTAERFGGLVQLSRFLAEDYMAGRAMRFLGLKVAIMHQPVRQPLAQYTLKDFWNRHLRWGRIRKAQAPVPVFFEPLLTLFPSGLAGAWGFSHLFGLDGSLFMLSHLLFWLISEQLTIKGMGGKFGLRSLAYCFLRETLSVPIWAHMWCGNTVNWRGTPLRVKPGGVLELSQGR